MTTAEWVATIQELVERENEVIRARLVDFYPYARENYDAPDTVEAFLEEMASQFVTGPAASPEEVAALEAAIGAEIPAGLREFYLKIGELDGEFGDQSMSFVVPRPSTLVESLGAERRYQRLFGMTLYDMIQRVWGNDRRDLTPEEGFPQSEVDALRQYFCFGHFSDGFCESHGYLFEESPNRFSIYKWHQDDVIGPVGGGKTFELIELVATCLHSFPDACEIDPDGDVFFEVSMLAEKVTGLR